MSIQAKDQLAKAIIKASLINKQQQNKTDTQEKKAIKSENKK